MLEFIFVISFFILIFLLNYYSEKKNLLTNKTGELHQSFTSTKVVPLLGGVYLFYGFFIILYQLSLINVFLILFFFFDWFFFRFKNN